MYRLPIAIGFALVLSAGCAQTAPGAFPSPTTAPTSASQAASPGVDAAPGADPGGATPAEGNAPRLAGLTVGSSPTTVSPLDAPDRGVTAPAPTVVTLVIGDDAAATDPEAHRAYEAQYEVLRTCLTALAPDVDGVLLVRLHIDERSEVSAVTVGWRFHTANGQPELPNSLEAYADSVECMEAALLHTPVFLADAGAYALGLEVSVR